MFILLIAHIIVTLLLILVILMQHSEGGGNAFAGASAGPGSLMTAKGTANLLTKVTAVLATLFIGNCVLMTILSNRHVRSNAQVAVEPEVEKKNKDDVAKTITKKTQLPIKIHQKERTSSADANPLSKASK